MREGWWLAERDNEQLHYDETSAGVVPVAFTRDPPHSVRAPQSLDLGFASYFAVLFGPPKADKDNKDKKEAPTAPDENQEEDKKKPSPEDILLTVVQPPC